MNKKDLVEHITSESTTADSKAAAERQLVAVVNAIKAGLKKDGKVQIVGLGNFTVKDRAARKGRNPKTGEEIQIKASRTVAFRPGKKLKEFVAKKATKTTTKAKSKAKK